MSASSPTGNTASPAPSGAAGWGAPAAVFVVAVVVGMLAKLWRVGELWLEADTLVALRWLPLGLGPELLVGGVAAGAVALLGRGLRALRPGLAPRSHAVVVAVVAALVLVAEIAWLGLNDVSYRVSQIGITYFRIRGGEGVHFADFQLVDDGDVIPAIVYGVVAALLGIASVVVLRRRPRLRPSPRAVALAAVVGAGLTILDLAVFADRNFGMAESPVVLIARTWAKAFMGREEIDLGHDDVPTPKTKAERLALLRARQPQPSTPTSPPTTPTRSAPAVKNGILFFSEGIAHRQTGLAGEPTTPKLMAALEESGGLEFDRYYAPYHKSIAAIFSMTCADFPPPDAKNITSFNPRIDCGALPEVMQKNGVHPGLFHGGEFGFYDKLQLLGMRGFEIQKDAQALKGPGVWQNDWGVDDRVVVDAALAWIDTIPVDERFFIVLIPITAHYPYQIPPDVTPAFPGGAAKDRFYSAVHFLDSAFDRLREGLRARGRLDDTALLYMADHGETVGVRPHAQAGRRLAYEPSVHVPFAILAPKVFAQRQHSSRIGSHVDLLPTVLDLMGLPGDPRHHGQSLLSDDFAARRVFLGANNGPRYIGFLDGDQKFIFNRASGLQELYDLASDPFEQVNLADDHPDEVQRLTSEAIAFYDGQNEHLRNAPRVPGEVDVQQAFLDVATVQVVKPDGSVVDCARDPADTSRVEDRTGPSKRVDDVEAPHAFDGLPGRRVCPGMSRQPFLGAAQYRAGRRRECLLVNVPEGGGTLRMTVRDQPWQVFLTRARVGVDHRHLDDDDHATVTGTADGKVGTEKTVDRRHTEVRATFSSTTGTVSIDVAGERPLQSPICLTLTETAWFNRAPRREAED